jgi:hypothetical protein
MLRERGYPFIAQSIRFVFWLIFRSAPAGYRCCADNDENTGPISVSAQAAARDIGFEEKEVYRLLEVGTYRLPLALTRTSSGHQGRSALLARNGFVRQTSHLR